MVVHVTGTGFHQGVADDGKIEAWKKTSQIVMIIAHPAAGFTLF
ncbi:MAG: hypothetical protein SCH70_07680 [Candidatus Methanoperedens sp.]|nr:hypothetical protein [Candidatus Methanoperedens sp.]